MPYADNGRIGTKTMGSWRKVGAFLGLVPDEGRRDEFGDDYQDADGYRDEYADDEFDRGGAARGGVDRGHDSPYVAPGPRSVPGNYDEHTTHGALAVAPRPDLRRDPDSGTAIRPVTVQLTGFGAGVVSPLAEGLVPDQLARISELDTVLGCRLLAGREAIVAGASSGAVVQAFLQAAPEMPPGSRVVLVLHDGGAPYLDTVYDDGWVARQLGVGADELASRLSAESRR